MGTRTRIGRTVLSAVLSAALALQCSPAVAEPMAEEPMGAEAAGATTARQAQRTPAAASDGASAVAEEGALAEEPVAVQAPAAQPDAGQPEDAKQTADAGKTTDAKQAPADPAALAPEGEAADDAALAADGALSAQSDDGAIEAQAARPVLHAQAHVQDHGWMAPAAGRSVSVGTEHESRRVESLRLWVTGASGAVEGKVHVQDYGWLGWRASSPTGGLGTDGQSKRVEAMRLRLSSGLSSAGWHLYYRLHVQDLGWLGWARDGQLAGTAGYARRAEKVELRLVGPGEAAPGVGQAFRSRGFSGTGHVQDIGWQPERSGTRFSVGTSHQSRRVEAITLNRPGDDRTGDVVYQAHVQNIGWQGEVRNGQAAGTSGRSLRVEAIRVRLTGELERDYDVWYRVHAQDVGWMGWTRNGAKAGTQGYSRRLEAIEVAFLPKGSSTPSAPGQATSQPFMERKKITDRAAIKDKYHEFMERDIHHNRAYNNDPRRMMATTSVTRLNNDYADNLTRLMNDMVAYLRECAGINEAQLMASQRAWEAQATSEINAAAAQNPYFAELYASRARVDALRRRVTELFRLMETLF